MRWVILSVFVFVWGLPPFKAFSNGIFAPAFHIGGLHTWCKRCRRVVPAPVREGAVFTLNLLSATGTGILLSAIVVGALVMEYPLGQIVSIWVRTRWLVCYALMTIVLMLGLGTLTRHSGTDTTLGLALACSGVL